MEGFILGGIVALRFALEVVPLLFLGVLKRLRPVKVKVIEYLRDG